MLSGSLEAQGRLVRPLVPPEWLPGSPEWLLAASSSWLRIEKRVGNPPQVVRTCPTDIKLLIDLGQDSGMREKPTSFTMERYGALRDMDRSFDIEYWQRLGPEAIFEAAWQLAVEAHSQRSGGEDELRLRRTVEPFHRARG